MNSILFDDLIEYSNSSMYPFHMPGHKRNLEWLEQYGFFGQDVGNPYKIDITEIEGFDNLHDAGGILREGMQRISRLYGAEESHYLVNGSTVGLLAGISGVVHMGDKILVARNCHKAVYNAIYINQLNPVYLYPPVDKELGITLGICGADVDKILKNESDIKLIVIVSPTYEGVVSEIEEICHVAHRYHIPVLVDEAHGAHFGFSHAFPRSAVSFGADLVIHSVHKTLPSLTQTALIHLNGALIDYHRVSRFLSIYQSSSPSYVFMSSIDTCYSVLKKSGNDIFCNYVKNMNEFYNSVQKLAYIEVCPYGELSKIIISVKRTSMTGKQLYDILWKSYKLQMEMTSKDYVLAMTSVCDRKEGFQRLSEALLEIDQQCSLNLKMAKEKELEIKHTENYQMLPLEQRMSIYQAYDYRGEWVLLSESAGRILKDYIYLYPPGIPYGVPGEVVHSDLIKRIQEFCDSGLEVKGIRNDYVHVCIEEKGITNVQAVCNNG